VEGGAHRRASTGGDGGRGGAALSCARANAWEKGVRGARWGVGAPLLGPPGDQLLRMQHGQGARGACTPARRGYCGATTWPALRRGATWPGVGEGASTHLEPTVSAYGRKYAGRVGTPRRTDVAARARGRV
jgi:hypothetical protein